MGRKLGAAAWTGEHAVLTGSCSWTDRTLVEDSDWYPKRTMTAEERLRYYAAQFPLTEIDSTYYAPPAEQQARAVGGADARRLSLRRQGLLAADRPPDAARDSLWRDLREQLPPEVGREAQRLRQPPRTDALEEAWRRFEQALRPLHEAGKLGGVLFQYPPWFVPRRENRAEIDALRERLPDYRICVEFRSPMWLAEERDRERTLSMLEDHGLVFVCVDAPAVSGLPRLLACTNAELFMVRFHGRSDSTWSDTSRSAAERFRYLYTEQRAGGARRRRSPSSRSEARETHLLMNNCYRDYAVRNAGSAP